MEEKRFAGLRYEEVVHRYSQTVAAVCVMRVQNWADAEDCYQNVFLKLLTKAPAFRDENHLKAWLIRVAVNECKNYIRDNRRVLSLDSLGSEPVSFDTTSSDLSWALMRLPSDYREVLYLFYSERYTVREIASILGKRENTVKTLLRRGRERLKAIYGGERNGD